MTQTIWILWGIIAAAILVVLHFVHSRKSAQLSIKVNAHGVNNANLFAAAPDLLEAHEKNLKTINNLLESGFSFNQTTIAELLRMRNTAINAIVKAKGV